MRPYLSFISFVMLLMPGLSWAITPGTLTIQEDNDVFAFSDRSDRGYTNGSQLTWTWEESSTPSFALNLAGRLCGVGDCKRNASISIGQAMFTPENLQIREKIVGDRPYGGWLYSELSIEAQKEDRVDTVSLYLGAVGRRSYAAEAQSFAHRAIVPSAPEPLGWDNQVGDFPGIVVACDRRLQFRELSYGGRPYMDLIPSLNAMIGNVFIRGGMGATVRAGYNLPDKFVRTSASASGTESGSVPGTTVRSRWDGYLFATAEARFIAHDVFLDSNDREFGIRREPFVRDRRIGASLRYRWLRIQYIHNLRSSEFEPDSRSHSYGTYMLSLGIDP